MFNHKTTKYDFISTTTYLDMCVALRYHIKFDSLEFSRVILHYLIWIEAVKSCRNRPHYLGVCWRDVRQEFYPTNDVRRWRAFEYIVSSACRRFAGGDVCTGEAVSNSKGGLSIGESAACVGDKETLLSSRTYTSPFALYCYTATEFQFFFIRPTAAAYPLAPCHYPLNCTEFTVI